MRRVVFACLLAATAAACQKSPAPTAAAAQPAAATPETPPPPKPVPAELPDVLARVNGETIERTEFENAIRSLEARAGRPVPAEERDQVYRGVLDDLIAYRLLKQELATRPVTVDEAEIETRLKELRQQFGSQAALEKALAGQNMTIEKLREDARTDMRVNQLLEQEVNATVQVKPSDISAFYEKNPERFQEPEAVRASHILLLAQKSATEEARRQARGRAESVLKQVQAGGDFAKLAKQHSQDGTASNGGDLGFFPRGQMVPAFENVAFALETGQVSGVVETDFGFHIIKVTEKRPARTVPFTEVSARIEEYLVQQQRQEKAKAYVESLKSKGKIEILI